MSHCSISAPRSVGFSLSGAGRRHWGMRSARCSGFSVVCADFFFSVGIWQANQEAGQSFCVGGCKTLAFNVSNNFIAFTDCTVEI